MNGKFSANACKLISTNVKPKKNIHFYDKTAGEIKEKSSFRRLIKLVISGEVPASWSSGNAFVSGAGGLRFKSRAGQIGHSVANGSPPLRHFFERSCVARAQ